MKRVTKFITNAEIIAAYIIHEFNLSKVAETVGTDFNGLTYMRKTRPELRALMEEAKESVKDIAEAKMVEAIKAGDSAMIRFYLERKGGYREQKELAVARVGVNNADVQAALRRKHRRKEELAALEALDLSDL